MIEWSRKHSWITGLGILVVTNIVALAGVVYNRMGEPDASLVLTERELNVPYRRGFARENSGISLVIDWRTLPALLNEHHDYGDRWAAPGWLDEIKLDELGFEAKDAVLTPKSRARFNRSLSREAFLVLEYDGPAYQAMRARVKAHYEKEQVLARRNPENKEFEKRVERAANRWEQEQRVASRLFVVDAGLDPTVLRKQYPDKGRYLVARGQVRAAVNEDVDGKWVVRGFVRSLAVRRVSVPLAFRDVFEPMLKETSRRHEQPPRFSVTLAYGKRHEPWVVSVEKMAN